MANEEREIGENEFAPETNERDGESSEECWGVNFTSNGDGPPSDLDWGEIENFGTDSDVEQFLQNNEETQGYEDLQTPKDVDVFKISAKERIALDTNAKKQRNFRQFNQKLTWDTKEKIIFSEKASRYEDVRRKKETF